MDNQNLDFCSSFYNSLEKGIGELPQSCREELYRQCAENCVSKFVLKEQQRQFNECNSDLDLQYEKYGNTEFFFAKIIEKGHIYEIGYPVSECVCPMVACGMASTSVHCECSRQSMLCVLKTLLPDKKITVTLMHSVLTGAGECRFHVEIE